MSHKYLTRSKSLIVPVRNYALSTSKLIDSDDSDDSDYSHYSDDSDDSNYSYTCSSSSHINSIGSKHNKAFNKCEYYKFLSELFPSRYSKHKYKDQSNKRAKNEDTNINNTMSNNATLATIANASNSKSKKLYDNKVIKKKHRTYNKHKATCLDCVSNEEESDNEESDNEESDNEESDNEESKSKYKHKLLSEGFDKLFNNIKSSDKNINIIVNLKKGENKIYNNKSQHTLNDSLLSNMYCVENESDNESINESNNESINESINESNNKSNNESNIKISNRRDKKSKKDIIPAPRKLSNHNYEIFDKILNNEEKESEYFKKCLSSNSQLEAISKLQKINDLTKINKPYVLYLVDIDIPDEYKACALRKINTMRSMGGCGNSEYFKIKSWVDSFLKIPFNKYNNLPICFADGIDKCHDFMENAKNILDSVTYGLEDAKMQIMQMIGLWLVNPNAIGCAIAIKGPPGTGKTTLIKEGISKILCRPFALIALGGCGDAGFLDGFDYTYEGSKNGKIIDILISCGCMNPVILFDELDKLSDSFKGQEITGVLTHLTDSTQNSKFTDKYFSELTIDMSKALFIFSYNDESLVNPVLKDRMYKIETKGYKAKEKLIIAKDYLLPKIREEIKFDSTSIVFSDELIEYIINEFTEKEDGVRNLKRCLEVIHKKLNLYRLMKPDINLFANSDGLKLKKKISFPCILTKQIIDELINKESSKDIPYGMYV